tara:strand:+ start:355 stop:591 length:237 start_codon:yes stop_codon:yes gene_type:complete
MAKPDYATLLGQIASETDPTAKAALEAQCYVFTEALTAAEEELFGYVNDNYLLFNPGTEDNSFKSYVGVYYSDTGETT